MNTFPIEWNAWRAEWGGWLSRHTATRGDWQANKAKLHPTSLRASGKNFLADSILGTWAVHYRDKSGQAFELSEVTMPDFSKGYGADRVRYVGITKVNANGTHEDGGIVASFEELEAALGFSDVNA